MLGKKWGVAGILGLLLAAPVSAQNNPGGMKSPETAEGFVQSCKAMLNAQAGQEIYETSLTDSTAMAMQSGYCRGYIDAYIALASAVRARGAGIAACIPAGTNYDEIAKTFIVVLDANPSERNTSTLVFALGVMAGRYRCNKGEQQ